MGSSPYRSSHRRRRKSGSSAPPRSSSTLHYCFHASIRGPIAVFGRHMMPEPEIPGRYEAEGAADNVPGPIYAEDPGFTED